jgi:hypothetical protein
VFPGQDRVVRVAKVRTFYGYLVRPVAKLVVIVLDKRTENFITMVIRRFCGRRGDVKARSSDNGTNLQGAETELKKVLLELDGDRLTREFAEVIMKWKFNPPASPHFVGVWERLIKTVKKPCRHYWFKWSNPDDPESITPNHYLLGPRSIESTPPGRFPTLKKMCEALLLTCK